MNESKGSTYSKNEAFANHIDRKTFPAISANLISNSDLKTFSNFSQTLLPIFSNFPSSKYNNQLSNCCPWLICSIFMPYLPSSSWASDLGPSMAAFKLKASA